jgi:50S ribosomal protein L16 3-hydroxylase
MTWSIGMRAPSGADLFLALGEWLAEKDDEGGRYRDPGLNMPLHAGEIDEAALSGFGNFLRESIRDDPGFRSFLGTFLSRYRLAHEPAPPVTPVSAGALAKAFDRGEKLRHNPWTRLFWIGGGENAQVFAAGAEYSCAVEFARSLCDPERLWRLERRLPDAEMALLCELLNRGHLYLEQL